MTGGLATPKSRVLPIWKFDVEAVRKDFPILGTVVHDKPLVYLDNAATSQKPLQVISALNQYYLTTNANIHRGVHHLSQKATTEYEAARDQVRAFLNARSTKEIVFVRGATEAINLVAQSFARPRFKAGDEILITHMEHHANIVPWQILRDQIGIVLRVAPINDNGELILEEFEKLITDKTKLVAVTQVSNALGTIVPVKQIIEMARSRSIPVLIDGCQAVPHIPVDVQSLDCDFYVFSGHKIFGPTGTGVLYGKEALLDSMPPYQGGGDMISSVTFEKTTYNELPYKFEAGTPHIAGGIGLAAALEYVSRIGLTQIADYEHELLEYATSVLEEIPRVRIIGNARPKASVISFVVEGLHPHDIGTILDHEGIAIRTGHHCAQPVMQRFDIPATSRASFAFYNRPDEADALAAGLRRAIEVLG
ncbi:MAG: cysteine desulfurase [Candidatus Sumerlaeaceae bacterium]|nr:cysteine desulfurase [Candidatus Sumerlaeaceae bacterium]